MSNINPTMQAAIDGFMIASKAALAMSDAASDLPQIAAQLGDDDKNELLELMESTANMLRGMTLDPAIPAHAKDAMRRKIQALEAAVQKHLD